ncbi:universal stress protein [Vagococcus sp. BWB3-3]|uniref:Universal stress protein n=1 Tax=Vagococcus allomyrinae TaxID=2794353 RepID=A0A940SUM8_9ENTE|nr:universal stress protein [Vagococcus allomyrinae]MBP1044487.1 universal stress protein [Vagococcus allomyrinae]
MMLPNYQRVLVANDGSENSLLAFKEAVEIAKRNQASLYILRVVDTRIDPFAPYIIEGVIEEQLEEAKRDMNELADLAKEYGVSDVYPLVKQGQPRDIITNKVPERENIDLLVVGATGKTGLDKLWIGSTTNYVVNHATCNVLVIRNKKEK